MDRQYRNCSPGVPLKVFLQPHAGNGIGLWRKEGRLAQLFFLPELPIFGFSFLFCSVFPCLQSQQILPSPQPYCLFMHMLHAYYQEPLQSREVICSTGLFTLNVSVNLRCKCQGSCASKKKKVPKAVFLCCIFFPFHNEQHYYFQLRRTKRKYLLLKTFF